MSALGEAKARGRPREQGEAKERSSRLRARVAVDLVEQRVAANGAEAGRQRATALDDASEDRFKHMQYGVQQS